MSQLPLLGASAQIDGPHRYLLSRSWGDGARILWCMLNPSTADAATDDPTIRKCMGFARRWGFDGIDVVNLFSWRATNPREVLANLSDAATCVTDNWIRGAAADAPSVMCAWGRYEGRPWVRKRAESVLSALHFRGVLIECLGCNADGSPRHPLMLPYSTPRKEYGGPSGAAEEDPK